MCVLLYIKHAELLDSLYQIRVWGVRIRTLGLKNLRVALILFKKSTVTCITFVFPKK